MKDVGVRDVVRIDSYGGGGGGGEWWVGRAIGKFKIFHSNHSIAITRINHFDERD